MSVRKNDPVDSPEVTDGGLEARTAEREAVRDMNEGIKGVFILTRNLGGYKKGDEIDEKHPLRQQIRRLFLAGDAVRKPEEGNNFGAGSLPTL